MKAVVLFLPRPLKLDSPYDAKTSHHYRHHFRAHIFFTNMFSCERKKITSKNEQAPGRVFHPSDESKKKYCGFVGPSWCNKKINPETYVPYGSYKLLLSNKSHQMKEKLTIQNQFSQF